MPNSAAASLDKVSKPLRPKLWHLHFANSPAISEDIDVNPSRSRLSPFHFVNSDAASFDKEVNPSRCKEVPFHRVNFAAVFIDKLVKGKILPEKLAVDSKAFYETPIRVEDEPRNYWSLFNAITEPLNIKLRDKQKLTNFNGIQNVGDVFTGIAQEVVSTL